MFNVNRDVEGVMDIALVRGFLQPLGTYNTQYYRPFKLNADNLNMNAVADRLSRISGAANSPAPFQGIATQILRPSEFTAASQVARIPNGWEAPRFRFFLEFRLRSIGGRQFYYIVTGYTDHGDTTGYVGDNLDPKMRFTINNIQNVSRFQSPGQTRQKLNASDRIMADMEYAGPTNADHNLTLMRPSDVADQLGLKHSELMRRQRSTLPIGASNVAGMLASSSVTRVGSFAPSVLDTPDAWLSSFMTTYQHELNQDNGPGTVYESMGHLIAPNSVSNDPLVWRLVGDMFGGEAGQAGNTFTLERLMSEFPEAQTNLQMAPMDHSEIGALHHTGQSQFWNSNEPETFFALSIAYAMSGNLDMAGLIDVAFTVHNDTIDGRYIYTWDSNPVSLNDGDSDIYVRSANYFQDRMLALMDDVSHHGEVLFEVKVIANRHGDCRIWCGLNGRTDPVYHCSPIVADAMYSPLLSVGQMHFANMTNDIEGMLNEVRRISQKAAPEYPDGSYQGAVQSYQSGIGNYEDC